MARTAGMEVFILMVSYASMLYTSLAQNATTTTTMDAATSTTTIFTTLITSTTTSTTKSTVFTTLATTSNSASVATSTAIATGVNETTNVSASLNATTTTVPRPCNKIIEGSLYLDVNSEPALFVQNPESTRAVARGIAAEVDVDVSQVHVQLSLNTRRLSKTSNLRQNQFSGSVMVRYTIYVPPADSPAKQDLAASRISEKMAAIANDPAASSSLDTKFSEQFQTGDLTVTITGASQPAVRDDSQDGTIWVPTTTTPSVPTTTMLTIAPGTDEDFAHKQSALGASHVLGLLTILLVGQVF